MPTRVTTSVRRVATRTEMSTTRSWTCRTRTAIRRGRVSRAVATITRARVRREDRVRVLPSTMRRTFDNRVRRRWYVVSWWWPGQMRFIRSDWTLLGDHVSFNGITARQILPAVRARMRLLHACNVSGLVTFEIMRSGEIHPTVVTQERPRCEPGTGKGVWLLVCSSGHNWCWSRGLYLWRRWRKASLRWGRSSISLSGRVRAGCCWNSIVATTWWHKMTSRRIERR